STLLVVEVVCAAGRARTGVTAGSVTARCRARGAQPTGPDSAVGAHDRSAETEVAAAGGACATGCRAAQAEVVAAGCATSAGSAADGAAAGAAVIGLEPGTEDVTVEGEDRRAVQAQNRSHRRAGHLVHAGYVARSQCPHGTQHQRDNGQRTANASCSRHND